MNNELVLSHTLLASLSYAVLAQLDECDADISFLKSEISTMKQEIKSLQQQPRGKD